MLGHLVQAFHYQVYKFWQYVSIMDNPELSIISTFIVTLIFPEDARPMKRLQLLLCATVNVHPGLWNTNLACP